MKKIATIILALMTAPLAAQSPKDASTTTTVSFGGIVNCQAIALVATRIQSTDLRTNVDFTINDCAPGETIPHHSVANFRGPIPNQDLTTDKTGAKLVTTTPYGPMTITWTITKDSLSTYDATWKWLLPTNMKQTQHDEFQSTFATGTIGSFVVGQRLGYFVTSVLSSRE